MKSSHSLLGLIKATSLVAATSLVLFPNHAEAITLVEDTFSYGVTGMPLAGEFPSVIGSNAWQNWGDGNNANLLNESVSLNRTTPGSGTPTAGGVIPISYDSTVNPLLSVKADIKLGTGADSWAGVVLTGGGGSPYGSVLAFIRPNDGFVQLFTNLASSYIAGGQIANFDINQTYTLELQFNYGEQTAGVLVNNAFVINTTSVLVRLDPIPPVAPPVSPIVGAGFFANGSSYPTGTLDNFVVQAVPEPGTVTLLVIAGLVFLVMVRRNHLRLGT